MKKTLIRMIIALAITSIALPSCIMRRDGRRTEKGSGHDHDRDNHYNRN